MADQALGKILKDEETVESYKIEEKGFVVCVVNKVLVPASPRRPIATFVLELSNMEISTAQGPSRASSRVLVGKRSTGYTGAARRLIYTGATRCTYTGCC